MVGDSKPASAVDTRKSNVINQSMRTAVWTSVVNPAPLYQDTYQENVCSVDPHKTEESIC